MITTGSAFSSFPDIPTSSICGGSPSGGGTLSDTFLNLDNSAGTLLASNDDGGVGFDLQLAVRVSTTGTYYVDAGAFNDLYAGTYTVEISDSNCRPFHSGYV